MMPTPYHTVTINGVTLTVEYDPAKSQDSIMVAAKGPITEALFDELVDMLSLANHAMPGLTTEVALTTPIQKQKPDFNHAVLLQSDATYDNPTPAQNLFIISQSYLQNIAKQHEYCPTRTLKQLIDHENALLKQNLEIIHPGETIADYFSAQSEGFVKREDIGNTLSVKIIETLDKEDYLKSEKATNGIANEVVKYRNNLSTAKETKDHKPQITAIIQKYVTSAEDVKNISEAKLPGIISYLTSSVNALVEADIAQAREDRARITR